MRLDHLPLIDATQVRIALNAGLYQQPVAAGEPYIVNLWTIAGSDSDGRFSVYTERRPRTELDALPVAGTRRASSPPLPPTPLPPGRYVARFRQPSTRPHPERAPPSEGRPQLRQNSGVSRRLGKLRYNIAGHGHFTSQPR